MRKVSSFVLFLLLCSVWVSILKVGIVKAEGTIQISHDGSIQGTELIQRTNNTYTFTSDISGNIVVLNDFITIDGAGFTLIGSGYSPQTGIDLTFRKNVTVKNLVIIDYDVGIFCRPGAGTITNITILGNYILLNFYGIALFY